MTDYQTEARPMDEQTYPTEEPAPERVANNQEHFEVQSSRSASETRAHPDEYPTEEDAHPDKGMIKRAIPAGAVTSDELQEARDALARRRAEYERRVSEIMAAHDFHDEELPSLQALREERVRMSEQIRHHKDEQDSLTLDIEGQEGAAEIYQIAARVQRFEHFAARSETYVNTQLRAEIDQVVKDDQRNSEEEIAAFIQELQNKREADLKKIANAQERTMKGAKRAEPEPIPDDENTKRAIEHAESNINNMQTLSEKVKKFRALKTKLSSEIAKEKRDSQSQEQQLKARIKNAELVNARDSRQCKELNNGNAALTSNSQLLMSQLNFEHYGLDNAPTEAQLIQDRKERAATPQPTPANGGARPHTADNASVSSRASKPPLVAMKRTESQRNRDEASREEREMQQRRSSEVGSHTSSRRQSLSKPPLVAMKRTESQRNRDEATRQGRE